MPADNTLITGPILAAANGRRAAPTLAADGYAFEANGVHITLVGLVILAVAGLALLHKIGFRFSVTVGGGS